MWTGRKLGLHHVHIWGYPTHVLKQEVEKLEPRLEVCQFVRYSKGTRGYYFYSQVDQKVFMSKNVKFLENNSMMSNNIRSEVNLRYLDKTPTTVQNTMDLLSTILISSITVPHCSGKVVIQSD